MTDRLRIGVVGSSGFIGSHVTARALASGLDVRSVQARRAVASSGGVPGDHGGLSNPLGIREIDILASALSGLDVVVNAAGLARPGCSDDAALVATNVVLPASLALACRQADVRRFVHVSTAAVQGRRDPLDETDHHSPFSPYTRSKAEAERRLRQADTGDLPQELILYRPASVHGPGRRITRLLCRVARGPLVTLAGTGDQPLPVALVDNVAAGILFAATSSYVAPVVVQPSEGLTTRRLFELLGSTRFLSVPDHPLRWALRTIRRPAAMVPAAAAVVRNLEVLYLGQRMAESSLTRAGFVPPVGLKGWSALADATLGHPASVSASEVP